LSVPIGVHYNAAIEPRGAVQRSNRESEDRAGGAATASLVSSETVYFEAGVKTNEVQYRARCACHVLLHTNTSVMRALNKLSFTINQRGINNEADRYLDAVGAVPCERIERLHRRA
jgi:hypothetical protein